MVETDSYTYRTTKAVDMVRAPTFATSAITFLVALIPGDIENRAPNSLVYRPLTKMKCVELVERGSGEIPNMWRVKFEPGRECKGCYFFRKIEKTGKIKCARVERYLSTSKRDFQSLKDEVHS